jgi:hypothetical protein
LVAAPVWRQPVFDGLRQPRRRLLRVGDDLVGRLKAVTLTADEDGD